MLLLCTVCWTNGRRKTTTVQRIHCSWKFFCFNMYMNWLNSGWMVRCSVPHGSYTSFNHNDLIIQDQEDVCNIVETSVHMRAYILRCNLHTGKKNRDFFSFESMLMLRWKSQSQGGKGVWSRHSLCKAPFTSPRGKKHASSSQSWSLMIVSYFPF